MNIRVDIAYQQQVILKVKTFRTCISMVKKKKIIGLSPVYQKNIRLRSRSAKYKNLEGNICHDTQRNSDEVLSNYKV